MDIKAILTEREWKFLQASLTQDEEELAKFGDDADLLRKSIDAKIKAAEPPEEIVDGPVSEVIDESKDSLSSVIPSAQAINPSIFRAGERVYYKPASAVFRVRAYRKNPDGEDIVILSSGAGRAEIKAPRSMVSRVHTDKRSDKRPRTTANFKARGVMRFDRD